MKNYDFKDLFVEEKSSNFLNDLEGKYANDNLAITCLAMWLTCNQPLSCGNSTKEACDFYEKYCK